MLIRKWHLKAVVQKFISLLPASQKVNYVFQKHITKGLTLTDDLFFDRLGHGVEHYKAFQKYAQTGVPLRTAFELGTGWYPIVPFAMYLYGAERITTTDIDKLCTSAQCINLAKMYVRQYKSGGLSSLGFEKPERFETLSRISDMPTDTPVDDLLALLNITYLVLDLSRPADIGSFDLVTSNNTFEHVYPEVLAPILSNLNNGTARGGVMSHFIDLSDHYAHMDSSINVYHFLRYSDAQWKMIDNSVQPMNRWRMPDYRKLYQELGINITAENVRPGDVGQLKTIPLDQRFLKNTDAENAISHAYVFTIKH